MSFRLAPRWAAPTLTLLVTLVVALVLAQGCNKNPDSTHTGSSRMPVIPPAKSAAKVDSPKSVDASSPEIRRATCPAQLERLDLADQALEDAHYDVALACAEDELLDDPENPGAEQERGRALEALDRVDEAQLAFQHALALDPDDPSILDDAASLMLSRGNVSREMDEIALEYARRGEKRARRRRPDLVGHLDLMEGMAFNDLGRSQEALDKLGDALLHDESDLEARQEHAVALFELCRFAEAKADLERYLKARPDDPDAHHELGLTFERLGETRAAAAELAKATALDPQAYPPPLAVSAAEFSQLVDDTVKGLPAPMQADLKQVDFSVADVPDIADLTADDPPLSPGILGLFRGTPLGQEIAGNEPRAILLYRRNLIRIARTKEELAQQVKVTLWHELGHLRGADDDELRLRGLE